MKQYINKWGIPTLLSLLILSFSNEIKAQVEELKTDEEVMVIAPFNPSISKASKLNFAPQQDTNRADRLQIDYLTEPILFETNYSVEKLQAAKFIDRKSPLYPQNYVRGGYGLYNTIYGEAFINHRMSKTSQMGVHLSHLSTNGGIEDYGYSASSLSTAKVWAQYVQRNYSSRVGIDYKRNRVHRYGFLLEDYPIQLANTGNDFKDDIKQTYSHMGFDFDISGNTGRPQNKWEVGLNYKYFWDQFKTMEHLLDLQASYAHPVNWVEAESQFIGLEFSSQTFSTQMNFSGINPAIDSSSNYFHGLYDLAPYYELNYESFNVELGAKLSMGLDSNTRVAVAPRVKVDVGFMGGDLTAYLEANGGYQNNSIYGFATENNYISPLVPLEYSQEVYHLKLGAKGRYLSYLDYHLFLETSSIKDLPMFITDLTSDFENSFTVIYDDAQKIGAGLELGFHSERWNVDVMGKYQSFSMDTASRAWQKPNLLYKIKVGYYVLENLKVSGLLLGQGKMYNLHQGEQTVEPWMDFSLMADYHLNKNLGFFVKATNIFSDQYMIWYNYPVQSIGFMGGLHFSF